MPYAEVAVNASAPLHQTFTYRVPDGLFIAPGHVVHVPFGPRTLQGVVMEVSEESTFREAREIEAVVEDRPLLFETHLAFAAWMSDYYLAPLFDCLSLMLPPGYKQRPVTLLQPLATLAELPARRLSDKQSQVLAYIIERGEAEAEELSRRLELTNVGTVVSSLMHRGFLRRSYRLARPAASPKIIRHLRLLIGEDEARGQAARLRAEGSPRTLRRAVLIEVLGEEREIPVARARALGMTPTMLGDLQASGVVDLRDLAVVRDPLAGRIYEYQSPPRLTADQQAAYQAISPALESPDGGRSFSGFLLHGVTGSGKTEVYLAALDRAVTLGKRAIVLVPEISLTPQTVRRFGERFPGRVAVIHSGLSLGEHFDMWQQVRTGAFDVVIGPRSALFSPQPDLGLVVMDEEHEWTYKQQEGSPRYHARTAAEELCRLTGAVLLLGSATPDIETYFRAQEGAYRLLELPQRLVPTPGRAVVAAPLPNVEVVDLREELKAGNRSIFSRSLFRAVRRALDAREQVILFLNRRGTASFVQCRDCGHVPECRSCSVALTYHGPEAILVCHYCSRRMKMPERCPVCGGNRIRMMGLGTERVEEEARRAFPGARTLRWDRDVTRGRDSHEAILARFLAREADVLIGTQMIAKGLDMPLVTLVGVISADIALHLPDFRASERSFQLLEQVAGRAGRGPKGGRVIIQTYNPDHHSIQAAALHDYHAFYQREIEFRRRLGYPPFGRLARLSYAHAGSAHAQEQAAVMAHRLKLERDHLGIPNVDILGPAPAFVPRIRGRWRWQIILRGSDPRPLLAGIPLPRGWTLDVNPVSLL